jgi:phosphate transport system substrate-binding protein
MIFGFNGNTRMKKLAGALVLAFAAASSAHAAIQVGGGATLPAVGYVGDVSNRLNYAPDANSLLGAYKSVTGTGASYCQTGSGAGKNILAGVSGTSVQNACPNGSTAPTGFGASDSHINRTTLTQPNFAGSDSPLSTTDYNNYVANRSSSFPVQFPAVAGGIAIVYNNSAVSGTLALTTAQVCGVFSGAITKWSDLGVAGSSPDTITVVYRSDGSGTSFGFSNFLSKNCPGSTPAKHFVTDQSYVNVVQKYFTLTSTTPNWNGQSGNANVVNQILSVPGAIGYAEAANAQAAFGSVATVDGKDPVADLGDATNHKVAIGSTDVVYNNAITGVDANTGRPTFAAIAGAPSTSCIALVKPDAYATPAAGYPIVAVSYLLGNSANNGADAASVRALIGAPYNSSIVAATGTIGAGTGLAFLDVSATSITQTQINGCIN